MSSSGHRRRRIDLPRRVAFEALDAINGGGAFANLALADMLGQAGLGGRDAAFVTELVFGTCRMQGTYDRIIEAAGGRDIYSLQPEVVDVLRLGAHQLLSMRVAVHAAVSTTVNLAGVLLGEQTTGVVNAIIRKVGRQDFAGWLSQLCRGLPSRDQLALRYAHPRWIVDALADALAGPGQPVSDAELADLLAANNVAPTPMLVVRPGLAEVSELVAAGGQPAKFSAWGISRPGDPSQVAAVRQGRAGVQDEGSQLVVQAAVSAAGGAPWLDLCAGPGGKSALLRALAPGWLLASEAQPHRAVLVAKALRVWDGGHQVIVADGRRPAWRESSFGLVLADVPCTGLGALRRRPESRWRRRVEDLPTLVGLQRDLLASALRSVRPGGVVAYVTCSPHRAETLDVIAGLPAGFELLDAPARLSNVPNAASAGDPRCLQLWPHRHGTDAMFCALVRRLY